MVNVFDAQARINENAPEAYRGLDRMDEARKAVLADLEAQDLIERVETTSTPCPTATAPAR